MNSFAAANFFENPLVLVIILLLGALSSWLAKRRRTEGAGDASNGEQLLPAPGEQERSTKRFNMEDVLRQLLGGEAVSQVPSPPPIASVMPDDQASPDRFEKETPQPERGRIGEVSESVAAGRQHRSRGGARVAALVRNSHTVRQAFIASVVFSSPKALENRPLALAGSE
ncbi:MAG: hypothetical protein HY735_17605 [Verrucomicrobia bacterium]|nr:hypothetical protein [Verrucomicrobiota bacterium]